MSNRWSALFRALTSDTMDTVDTVLLHAVPAAQTVKTVQSVRCQDQTSEGDVGLPFDKRIDVPLAKTFAALERRCPDYVEAGRWRQAVEDGRRFLAQWGEQAAAFGWTSRDPACCDRRLRARPDHRAHQ